jgi:mannose-1-phosphate guanylyltransferase
VPGVTLEAVLLVGGEGTRLRPLTHATPKPMLPVAGVPITVHQITRARAAGVTRIVLGTAYRAEVFAEQLGDGSALGVEIVYAHEDTPLGTGGAIRNAASRLTSAPEDPVLILNGDVLSGVDMGGLVTGHVAADAAVTLHLTRVADPRRYGLVPTDGDGRVTAFLEKPQTPEEIVTDQINAGCYVFRRNVIDLIAPERVVSVEREVFPALLDDGAVVRGVVDESYWLDLGTPFDFVRGSADLVLGVAPWDGHAPAPRLILDGADVAADAIVDRGSTIGMDAVVGPLARVSGSVLLDSACVDSAAQVVDSVIGRRSRVGARARIDGAVLGDDVVVEPGVHITPGARIEPGTVVTA